jgi:hypothetical protein
VIAIRAVEPLLDAQVGAMRAAGSIEPGPLVGPNGLDDKRVIIHPLAHRISIPSRFGIFGEFPAVGPDDAPDFGELVQDDHVLGPLKDLSRPEFIKVFARKSLGITEGEYGIIVVPGENASGSIAWLGELQHFQPQRSVGRLVFRLAVIRECPRAEWLDSARVPSVPNPGNVVPRGGG